MVKCAPKKMKGWLGWGAGKASVRRGQDRRGGGEGNEGAEERMVGGLAGRAQNVSLLKAPPRVNLVLETPLSWLDGTEHLGGTQATTPTGRLDRMGQVGGGTPVCQDPMVGK